LAQDEHVALYHPAGIWMEVAWLWCEDRTGAPRVIFLAKVTP
jgi:hypothetical protein